MSSFRSGVARLAEQRRSEQSEDQNHNDDDHDESDDPDARSEREGWDGNPKKHVLIHSPAGGCRNGQPADLRESLL